MVMRLREAFRWTVGLAEVSSDGRPAFREVFVVLELFAGEGLLAEAQGPWYCWA